MGLFAVDREFRYLGKYLKRWTFRCSFLCFLRCLSFYNAIWFLLFGLPGLSRIDPDRFSQTFRRFSTCFVHFWISLQKLIQNPSSLCFLFTNKLCPGTATTTSARQSHYGQIDFRSYLQAKLSSYVFLFWNVAKIKIFADSSDFIEKGAPFSEQMRPKYRTCAQNLTSQNSSGDSGDSEDSPDSADSPEMAQTGPVQPWVLHAPGAKMMVVYTKTPSNKNKEASPRDFISWKGMSNVMLNLQGHASIGDYNSRQK